MDEEECGLAAVIEEEEPQSADEVGATQVKACSSIRYSTTVHSFSEHFPKYRPENTSANCAAFQSTSTHSRTSVVADVAMVAAAKPLSTSSATVRRTARILYSCASPFRGFFSLSREVFIWAKYSRVGGVYGAVAALLQNTLHLKVWSALI